MFEEGAGPKTESRRSRRSLGFPPDQMKRPLVCRCQPTIAGDIGMGRPGDAFGNTWPAFFPFPLFQYPNLTKGAQQAWSLEFGNAPRKSGDGDTPPNNKGGACLYAFYPGRQIIRRRLVSSFLADVTQQIHSLRAKGVISAHTSVTIGSDSIAFRKSAGILWTGFRSFDLCSLQLRCSR